MTGYRSRKNEAKRLAKGQAGTPAGASIVELGHGSGPAFKGPLKPKPGKVKVYRLSPEEIEDLIANPKLSHPTLRM